MLIKNLTGKYKCFSTGSFWLNNMNTETWLNTTQVTLDLYNFVLSLFNKENHQQSILFCLYLNKLQHQLRLPFTWARLCTIYNTSRNYPTNGDGTKRFESQMQSTVVEKGTQGIFFQVAHASFTSVCIKSPALRNVNIAIGPQSLWHPE